MTTQNPYVIRGIVKLNGVLQVAVSVTVRNDTKSEEFATSTDSDGKFYVDLGDKTKFASDYAENDVVKVTALGATNQTTVTGTGSTPPTGYKNVDIDITTVDVADSGAGAEGLSLQVTHSLADSGLGTDATPTLQATHALADVGAGIDEIGRLDETLEVADSGSGTEALKADETHQVADSGLGADTAFLGAYTYQTVIDVGAGAEVPAVNRSLTLGDNGVGVDLPVLAAAQQITDAGVGTENIVTSQGAHEELIIDSGQGNDGEVGIFDPDIFDPDIFDDIKSALKIEATHQLQDSGVGTEAVQTSEFGQEHTIADGGTGTEVPTVLPAITILETGVAIENVALNKPVTVSDVAIGTETVMIGMELAPFRISVRGAEFTPFIVSGAAYGVSVKAKEFTPLIIKGEDE